MAWSLAKARMGPSTAGRTSARRRGSRDAALSARREVVEPAKVRPRPAKAQQRMPFVPSEALSEVSAHDSEVVISGTWRPLARRRRIWHRERVAQHDPLLGELNGGATGAAGP